MTNSKHLLHMRCCRSRPPKLSKLALASGVLKFQEVSITIHLSAVRMVGSARPQIGAEGSKVALPMAKIFISGIYQLGKMTFIAYQALLGLGSSLQPPSLNHKRLHNTMVLPDHWQRGVDMTHVLSLVPSRL